MRSTEPPPCAMLSRSLLLRYRLRHFVYSSNRLQKNSQKIEPARSFACWPRPRTWEWVFYRFGRPEPRTRDVQSVMWVGGRSGSVVRVHRTYLLEEFILLIVSSSYSPRHTFSQNIFRGNLQTVPPLPERPCSSSGLPGRRDCRLLHTYAAGIAARGERRRSPWSTTGVEPAED